MRTKIVSGLLLTGMLLIPGLANAAGEASERKLVGVAAAELPARVVAIVKAAPQDQRRAVAVETVNEAVAGRPAASPAVVGAVARSFPDLAGVAAATATKQHPKLAADIARAAAGAAPEKAGDIAVEVCRAVPSSYKSVVQAVSKAAPKGNRDVLVALAAAFPDPGGGVEPDPTGYAGNQPSAVAVMGNVKPQMSPGEATAGTGVPAAASTDSPAPPYISTSTSGTNATPSTSGAVPRGGRNYARP